MNKEEFAYFRKEVNKTQKEMAQLLGSSLKAVQSYEQGWRRVPVHAERQILFLFARKRKNIDKLKPCWMIKKCPPEQKKRCPAWEFRAGRLCWFINGTICEGIAQKDWSEKIRVCRNCEVFAPLLSPKARRGKARARCV